jgi:hypothetical protein
MRDSAPRTIHELPVFGFKDSEAGVEHLPFGDDDHVEARCDLVATKCLTDQPFGAISLDGSAKFLRRGNTQAAHRLRVGQDEQRAVASMNARSALINQLKLGTAPNAFERAKSLVQSTGQAARLLAADREALAALCATPLQHEAAVLRAHPNQEAVRPFAATRIRLKSALALHDTSTTETSRENELSMVAKLPEECQSWWSVLQSASSRFPRTPSDPLHACLVCPHSFPHLWKNLWKFACFVTSEDLANLF